MTSLKPYHIFSCFALDIIAGITGNARHQEVGREADRTAVRPTNAQRKMRELSLETETAPGESDPAAEIAADHGQETGNALGKTCTRPDWLRVCAIISHCTPVVVHQSSNSVIHFIHNTGAVLSFQAIEESGEA